MALHTFQLIMIQIVFKRKFWHILQNSVT